MAASSRHKGWLYKQNQGLLAAVLNGARSGASVVATNTALDGVLLGTPVTPALAVDSLVISNLVASGDILIAANNGGNSQAWLWVDASAGTLTLYGAGTAALTISSTAVKSSLALSPLASDGAALGTTALMWSDLFLASGAVINFNNGNVTLTHAANSLAIAGGDVTIASGYGLNVGSATQATVSDGDGATNLIPEVQALGVGTAFAGGALLIGTFNATNDRTVSPKLAFLKGAAATQVATTAVADNEVVGSIIAYGSDTGDFETPVAAIEFVVDDAGAPGASAIGGSIEFYTTADGGSTLTKALTISNTQALLIGASGSAVAFTQGSPQLAVYLTNASTHASNSVNSLYWETTMTGAAGVGGRALFYMTTNVALGGWSNALKAHVVYGASGRTTGLGSAFCAELELSAGTTSGTYAPLESELIAGSGASAGSATSFLYMNASGAGVAAINAAAGYLFELGSGVTDTAGGIFEAEVNTDSMSMTHVLKIRIAGTAYYIPLNTAKAF